ncbi:MAG: hypothetical protein LBD22_02705 [Spirochaetaceae bacterium]|jgi:hypothetical protein|nr:hypothetical protein [Spirochaetaceae bacterium]
MRSVVVFLVFGMFSGCAAINGVVEKGGTLLDGSERSFKTVERWRNLDTINFELLVGTDSAGTPMIRWKTPALPYLTFYGTVPDEAGFFQVISVHFLAGNYGGWNEYDVDARGRGRFRRFGALNGAWTLLSPITRMEIRGGKIRRDAARLIDDRALTALRNRADRVSYLSSWMRGLKGVPQFATQNTFEAYWRPRLLPKNKAERQAAPVLPELLEESREAGALESDWYEASAWIYVDYDWEKITRVLYNEYILTKDKE